MASTIIINKPIIPKEMEAHYATAANMEIGRLGQLLVDTEATWATKKFMGSLVNMEQNPSEQYTKCKKYYETGIEYIKAKRKFWSQFRDKSMDKNALDNIQGLMDEWFTNGLDYLGQENIRERSKTIKDEFQLFKLLFTMCPKKDRRKKTKK
jgi:hypothetical protein